MTLHLSVGTLCGFVAVVGLVACGESKTRVRPYLEVVESTFTAPQGSVTLIAPKGTETGRLGNWTLHLEAELANMALIFEPFLSTPALRLSYASETPAEDIEILSATYHQNNASPVALEVSKNTSHFSDSEVARNQYHYVNYVAPSGFDHDINVALPHIGFGIPWIEHHNDVVHRYHFDLIVNGEPTRIDVGFKVLTEIVKYRPTGVPGMP